MSDDEISIEDWLNLDSGFSDMLTKEWGCRLISLSAAVYWIATKGHAESADDIIDEQLEDAASLLVTALQSGELTARGLAKGDSAQRQIPVEVIETATNRREPFIGDPANRVGLRITWNFLLDDDRSDLIEDHCEVHWRDVRVKKADQLALLAAFPPEVEQPDEGISPAPDEPASDETVKPVEHYRTGLPGRDTSAPLILRKFLERCESRQFSDKLRQEAEYLADWNLREHPNAPPAKRGTVENILRVPFRFRNDPGGLRALLEKPKEQKPRK